MLLSNRSQATPNRGGGGGGGGGGGKKKRSNSNVVLTDITVEYMLKYRPPHQHAFMHCYNWWPKMTT